MILMILLIIKKPLRMVVPNDLLSMVLQIGNARYPAVDSQRPPVMKVFGVGT